MTQPSKHLLEAFKASSATPSSPPPSLAKGAAAGGASKPVATTPSLFGSAPSPRGIVIRHSQLPLLAVVALLALVCTFLLGRASVGSVQANAHETGATPSTASVAPPQAQPQTQPEATPAAAVTPDVDRQARSPAEQALLDTHNVYTIKLVEYSRSETNSARALETLRYLTDVVLFPAAVTSTSSRIVILVGAAAKQSELDDLLRRAKTIAGPPPASKPAEFHDAYIDKIDKLFPRKS